MTNLRKNSKAQTAAAATVAAEKEDHELSQRVRFDGSTIELNADDPYTQGPLQRGADAW